MKEHEALDIFRKYVDGFTLRQDAAADLQVSPSYLIDLYRGTRPLTSRMLEHIGLKRETVIKKVS